uniref:NADH dehydrogenase subunit 6 n=1 Tax=Stephanomia amphytridis TaxID=645353 RepID=UPI0026E2E8CF|nr:NADH dehydrogenase subunit 6 [Stephanomia amphytridis]WJJ70202.1 NADH dehydrogenase subunit 6 [Stephanomia amphytridis]
MIQLFNFFSLLILFSTIMSIISLNPIHSVFWLVFIFLTSSGLLISLGLNFIPLIIIIIYVGAIAILFLFVIMMLDIIELIEITSINNILPILFIIGINLILELLLLFKDNLKNYINLDFINWSFENINQIYLIGNIIYSDYFYPFILVSILLLIAMIGAIVLTLELSVITRRQILVNQHQRNNSWI